MWVALKPEASVSPGGERQRQGGACLIVGIFVNTLKGDEVGCKVEHLRGGASGGARTRDFALGVAAAVQKGKALHEQQEHKGQVESVFHDESFLCKISGMYYVWG